MKLQVILGLINPFFWILPIVFWLIEVAEDLPPEKNVYPGHSTSLFRFRSYEVR
jgi:hypothetical protein